MSSSSSQWSLPLPSATQGPGFVPGLKGKSCGAQQRGDRLPRTLQGDMLLVCPSNWLWLSCPCSEGASVSLHMGLHQEPHLQMQTGLLGGPFAGNPFLDGGQPLGITTGHCLGSWHSWLGGTACVQGGASQGLQASHWTEGLEPPRNASMSCCRLQG